MTSEKIKTRKDTGAEAEGMVAAMLESMGYMILARNYNSRFGELDIIARKNGLNVFVEVKYRKNIAFGTPAEAVSASKRKKIIKTAEIYIAENSLYDTACRFDVAEVFPNGKINIIEDAFSLDDIPGGEF